MVTDEDRKHHRHLWASFFKATTWEINMLATQDKNIELAANKLYKLSKDQRIRDEIWARQDAIRQQIDLVNYHKQKYEEMRAKVDEIDPSIAENNGDVVKIRAEIDARIAEADSTIARLKAEINQLIEEKLEKINIEVHAN